MPALPVGWHRNSAWRLRGHAPRVLDWGGGHYIHKASLLSFPLPWGPFSLLAPFPSHVLRSRRHSFGNSRIRILFSCLTRMGGCCHGLWEAEWGGDRPPLQLSADVHLLLGPKRFPDPRSAKAWPFLSCMKWFYLALIRESGREH